MKWEQKIRMLHVQNFTNKIKIMSYIYCRPLKLLHQEGYMLEV